MRGAILTTLTGLACACLAVPVCHAQLFFGGSKAKLADAAKVTHSPGGMTITPSGSIILSLHQYQKAEERLVEITPEGTVHSFPNAAVSRGDAGAPFVLDAVLGLQCDKRGVVWMLDNGRRSEMVPKLVGWDSSKNELVKIIYLPAPATLPTSFLNDLAVDPEEPYVYITDPASGSDAALIVVNLETGLARRVLQGHFSVVPERIDITIDGRALSVRRPDGETVEPMAGAGPIAVDRKGRWVYFGPMAGRTLYRINTDHLRDTSLTPVELIARVEGYAPKPPCDGISMDSKDNIYVADIGNKAIGVIRENKKYEIFEADDRFLWPDGLCFGNDGKLYFYANQLHMMGPYNGGRDRTQPPFHIYKIKALASGTVGR